MPVKKITLLFTKFDIFTNNELYSDASVFWYHYVWYQPLYSPSESELILQIKDTTIYTETKSQIKGDKIYQFILISVLFSSKC